MNSNTKLTDDDLYEEDSTSPKKKLKNLVVFFCGVKNCYKQFQKKTQQIVVKREFIPHICEIHPDLIKEDRSNEQQLEKIYLKKKVLSIVQYYCLKCNNDKKFDFLDKPKISLLAHIQQEHKKEYEQDKDKWQQIFVGEVQNPNYSTTTGGRPPIRKLTNPSKNENSELDEEDKKFLEDNKVDYKFNGRIDTNQVKVYQDIMEEFNSIKNEMFEKGSQVKEQLQLNFDYQRFFGDYFKNQNQLQKLIDMINLIQSKKVFESEKITYALYLAQLSLISIAQELQPNKNEIQQQLTSDQQQWLQKNPFMKSKLIEVINDIIDTHPYQNLELNDCNAQNEMSFHSNSNGNQLSHEQQFQKNNSNQMLSDDVNNQSNFNEYQTIQIPNGQQSQSQYINNNSQQIQQNSYKNQNNYHFNQQQDIQNNQIPEEEEEDIFQKFSYQQNINSTQQPQFFENPQNNISNHNNNYLNTQNGHQQYNSQQKANFNFQTKQNPQQLQIQQQQSFSPQANQYNSSKSPQQQQQQQQLLNSKKSLEESSIEELQEQLEIIKRKSKQLDS